MSYKAFWKLIEMPPTPPPSKKKRKKKWMQNNCVILHPCLPTDYFWMGSFRTYPYPPPRRVRANSEGGVSKRMQFPRELGVVVSWGLFPGALSKTCKLLKTNSCSVEQAGSCFTVNGLLKQELLFWLMMFFIKVGWMFFFFTAYTIGSCHWLS